MNIISIIFYKLLQMTIVASVIGFTIIFIKKLLFKKISPKILYIMWGIFILSLMVPPFIESKTSVYNYIDISSVENFSQELAFSEQLSKNNTEISMESSNLGNSDNNLAIESDDIENHKINLKYVFPIIWFVGMIVLIFVYIFSNIIFKIKIGNNEFEDERIKDIFKLTKNKLKINKNIKIINQKLVPTPAIIGITKPKILLTDKIEEYNDLEIEYIFRHELSHYKRKDNAINLVLIILKTIHWFNPLIWLIIREIRRDMEFAADEKAVKGLEQEDKKEYCKLLVNLANNRAETFMAKAIGITDDKNNLEKRIDMIKLSDKISKHPIFASCLVFIIIGLICLILYTNNYYLPELEMPPKLYLKDDLGRTTEMALVEYNWNYNGEIRTYGGDFDVNSYEFKPENMILRFSDPTVTDVYSAFTFPKYRMNYIIGYGYDKYPGTHVYQRIWRVGYDVYATKYQNKNNTMQLNHGIETMEVYFPNNSTAKYAVKSITFEFCKKEIFDKYANTKLADNTKIERLLKELELGTFLNSIKIENNILYLNYEYAQNTSSIADIGLVLFTNIPELEKIIYTSNQKNVTQQEDNRASKLMYNEQIELTKEVVNEFASVTLEELQMILNER